MSSTPRGKISRPISTDKMSVRSSVFVFTQKLAGALRLLLQTEYLGQHSKGGGIRTEARTDGFPPTFSTAFPLVGPSAPCHYERAASAWRGAWRGTRLLSAPPSDTISHGSSRWVSAEACQTLAGRTGEPFHYINMAHSLR